MNLRLKKELIAKCNDKELMKEFFDDVAFLESIKNKSINEVTDEEKEYFNEIIDSLRDTALTIAYLFLDDYYVQKKYKFISFFLVEISSRFSELNKEYSDMLKSYSRRLEELGKALDSLDELDIEDIILLYELIFLTFLTAINDLAICDYNMLNKNKYVESDLKDLTEIKESAKAYELSLITLNRRLKRN